MSSSYSESDCSCDKCKNERRCYKKREKYEKHEKCEKCLRYEKMNKCNKCLKREQTESICKKMDSSKECIDTDKNTKYVVITINSFGENEKKNNF